MYYFTGILCDSLTEDGLWDILQSHGVHTRIERWHVTVFSASTIYCAKTW